MKLTDKEIAEVLNVSEYYVRQCFRGIKQFKPIEERRLKEYQSKHVAPPPPQYTCLTCGKEVKRKKKFCDAKCRELDRRAHIKARSKIYYERIQKEQESLGRCKLKDIATEMNIHPLRLKHLTRAVKPAQYFGKRNMYYNRAELMAEIKRQEKLGLTAEPRKRIRKNESSKYNR